MSRAIEHSFDKMFTTHRIFSRKETSKILSLMQEHWDKKKNTWKEPARKTQTKTFNEIQKMLLENGHCIEGQDAIALVTNTIRWHFSRSKEEEAFFKKSALLIREFLKTPNIKKLMEHWSKKYHVIGPQIKKLLLKPMINRGIIGPYNPRCKEFIRWMEGDKLSSNQKLFGDKGETDTEEILLECGIEKDKYITENQYKKEYQQENEGRLPKLTPDIIFKNRGIFFKGQWYKILEVKNKVEMPQLFQKHSEYAEKKQLEIEGERGKFEAYAKAFGGLCLVLWLKCGVSFGWKDTDNVTHVGLNEKHPWVACYRYNIKCEHDRKRKQKNRKRRKW